MKQGALDKKLGFGAMRLPVQEDKSIDYAEVTRMVDTFMEEGFCYFDTAYPYHDGKSEIALRECLVKRYPREDFLLADKMPMYRVETAEDLPKYFAEQLERCGVGYFDYYLLHNMGVATYQKAQETNAFAFAQQLKKEGKIKNAGFSFHDQAPLLDQILTDHPEVDFVQLQINYMDWDHPVVQSQQIYEVARKHNVPIIVMEPIKGGGLAKLTPSAEAYIDALGTGASPASYALRFAASLPGVFMVLSGMSSYAQLLENTTTMKNFEPMKEEEQAAVFEAAAALKRDRVIGCTECRYCVEHCPVSIPIPDIFSAYNAQKMFGDGNFPVMHYTRATQGKGKASDCIQCGACEEHCPQQLPIRDLLKQMVQVYEQ